MSRTWRTRPWRVQVADPNNWPYLREHHDHRDGVCDLAPARVAYDHRGGCYGDYFWKKLVTCSCWMCGNRKYRKRYKRAARNRWRSARQRILALTPDQYEEVSIPYERYREGKLRLL
jgi:hypothetical protein